MTGVRGLALPPCDPALPPCDPALPPCDPADLDPLLAQVGNPRVMAIGGAGHGRDATPPPAHAVC